MATRDPSGYNDYMAKRAVVVGSRELKTRLGAYLERVRRGETIVVTDRGAPVAELRPVEAAGDDTALALRRMEAEGLVTQPSRTGRLTRRRALALPRGVSASAAIRRERDEGW